MIIGILGGIIYVPLYLIRADHTHKSRGASFSPLTIKHDKLPSPGPRILANLKCKKYLKERWHAFVEAARGNSSELLITRLLNTQDHFGCTPSDSAQRTTTDLRLACSQSKNEAMTSPSFEDPCHRALYEYQKALVDQLMEGKPLEEISDIELLSTKMMFAMVNKNERDKVSSIAKRILEIDPQNILAARVALKMLQSDAVSQGGNSPAFQEKIQSGLEQLHHIDPADEVLWTTKLEMALRSANHSKVEGMAIEYDRLKPNSNMSRYYLAWSRHFEHDTSAAMELLGESLDRDPTDVGAQRALDHMSKNPLSSRSRAE